MPRCFHMQTCVKATCTAGPFHGASRTSAPGKQGAPLEPKPLAPAPASRCGAAPAGSAPAARRSTAGAAAWPPPHPRPPPAAPPGARRPARATRARARLPPSWAAATPCAAARDPAPRSRPAPRRQRRSVRQGPFLTIGARRRALASTAVQRAARLRGHVQRLVDGSTAPGGATTDPRGQWQGTLLRARMGALCGEDGQTRLTVQTRRTVNCQTPVMAHLGPMSRL